LGKEAEPLQRERLQVRLSSRNNCMTWRFLRPWMRGAAQRSSQCASQVFWSSMQLNFLPLSAVFCVCLIVDSIAPFLSGSATRAASATEL